MTDSSNDEPPLVTPIKRSESSISATNTFFSQLTDLTTGLWSPIAVPVIDSAKNVLTRYITSATTHMIPTHTGYPVAVHEMLGSGEGTLVVIHGLASCSSDWVEFLKLAQYKFGRILAVDIPGHGESPFPPEYAGVDTTCHYVLYPTYNTCLSFPSPTPSNTWPRRTRIRAINELNLTRDPTCTR